MAKSKRQAGYLLSLLIRKPRIIKNQLERVLLKESLLVSLKKKYLAALLSITSLDLKKQAEVIGVSYGLVRKWHSTEIRFMELQDTLIEEFGGLFEKEFLSNVEKKYYKYEGEEANYPKDPLEQMKQIEKEMEKRRSEIESFEDKMNYYGFGFLSDLWLYGKEVILFVLNKLHMHMYKTTDSNDDLQVKIGGNALRLYTIIAGYNDLQFRKEWRKISIRTWMDVFINILSVDRLSNRKRKLIVHLLKGLLDVIEI